MTQFNAFVIKTLNETGMEGSNLDVIKAINEKPTAHIRLHDELSALLPRSGRRRGRALTRLLLRDAGREGPAGAARREKAMTGARIRKK